MPDAKQPPTEEEKYHQLNDRAFEALFEFLKEVIDASVCPLHSNDKKQYANMLTNIEYIRSWKDSMLVAKN